MAFRKTSTMSLLFIPLVLGILMILGFSELFDQYKTDIISFVLFESSGVQE